VPPFLRRVLPRVSLDGELLAVPGVAQDIGWRPGPGEAGVELVIERREFSATGDEIEPPGALW
jgi:hypothetical protein